MPYDKTLHPWTGYKFRGEGWYYLEVNLSDEEIESARLVFEGVLGQTVVYVNGNIVKRNFSGYNRFTCDISCYLKPNDVNIIVLHVDATSWEAWSYEGAGLYRPAYIEFRKSAKIDTDNCFVRSKFNGNKWTVFADIITENANNCYLISKLYDKDKKVIYEEKIKAVKSANISIDITGANLWSPENPYLYKYTCDLIENNEVIDSFSANVGLKDVVWDKDKGILLNGKKYRVKGICCHQDHGGVGAAVTPELTEYRIIKLKELGINAYRCAHHSMPDSFYEICDRLGMLVMAENRHFSVCENALDELESLVKVARNHPCVFIYSIFNEEPWQKERRGYLLAKKMREHLLKFDDTRAVTGAMESGIVETLNASDALDVVGANYGNQNYTKYHELKPNKALIGTENCPTYATRGVYVSDKDKQVYDAYGTNYATFSPSITDTMKSVLDNEYCAGCFVWSGFDAYGEPDPYEWPSVTSHWGLMDNCGYKKDTAHLLSSWYKEELTVHLLPHWNFKKGEAVKVCAFTNGNTAELFVNGKSLGEKQVVDCKAEWNAIYKKGNTKVVARRGNEEITDEVVTTGAPYELILEDVTPKRDNNLTRIINVSVVDKNGNVIPNFNKKVCFSGENLVIYGVANGNPNGTQPNATNTIPIFNGRAQLIASASSLNITAVVNGLEPKTV